MCTRGVWQLEKLVIRYCNGGGSSLGTRHFIRDGLSDFARKYPHLEIEVKRKGSHHPAIFCHYARGARQHWDLRKMDQDEVAEIVTRAVQRSGRKITKLKKPVMSVNPSIQGEWSANVTENAVFTIKEL